jgi:hypothetical protein
MEIFMELGYITLKQVYFAITTQIRKPCYPHEKQYQEITKFTSSWLEQFPPDDSSLYSLLLACAENNYPGILIHALTRVSLEDSLPISDHIATQALWSYCHRGREGKGDVRSNIIQIFLKYASINLHYVDQVGINQARSVYPKTEHEISLMTLLCLIDNRMVSRIMTSSK